MSLTISMNWKTSKLLQPCDVDTNLFQILWMCHCLAMLEMANRNTEWIWVWHCWSLPEKRWRRCWKWWRVVIELIKLPMVRNKIFWSWLLISVPDFLWFWSRILFIKALKKKTNQQSNCDTNSNMTCGMHTCLNMFKMWQAWFSRTRWYKDWSTLDLKYNYQLHQLAYSLEHVGADADRLQLKIENVKVFHYSGKVPK